VELDAGVKRKADAHTREVGAAREAAGAAKAAKRAKKLDVEAGFMYHDVEQMELALEGGEKVAGVWRYMSNLAKTCVPPVKFPSQPKSKTAGNWVSSMRAVLLSDIMPRLIAQDMCAHRGEVLVQDKGFKAAAESAADQAPWQKEVAA
jgi:hypothetical protein